MNNKFLLHFAIIAALFTQIGHTATVFNNLSLLGEQTKSLTAWDTFTGYVFAVSLEMAIYLFTCKGKLAQAKFFGVMSFVVNCMYYHNTQVNFMVICSYFFSAIIPVTIWFYASLLHAQDETENLQQLRINELETDLQAIKTAENERLAKVAAKTKKRKETATKKETKKKKRQKSNTLEMVYNNLPEIASQPIEANN